MGENGNTNNNGVVAEDSHLGDGKDSSPHSDNELVDEMEAPWPATFERSISLLSSPIISAPHAELFTRSPKPGGTPLAGRRAQVSGPWLTSTEFRGFSYMLLIPNT